MANWSSSFYFSGISVCRVNLHYISQKAKSLVSTHVITWIIVTQFWDTAYIYWAHYHHTPEKSFGTSYLKFPINVLYKQNHTVCRGIRKTHELKVRGYAERMTNINYYLDILQVLKQVEQLEIQNWVFNDNILN